MPKQIIIVGSGMAGFGAARGLRQAGRPALIFDKNLYHGGHTASFRHEGGWIFDDGPHISFTRDERMQKLFAESVREEYEVVQACVNNYWKGHWIKHPAQCNLHGLPTDLVVKILTELAELPQAEPDPSWTYADWLIASYGKTFAETFPMEYGAKYHTTTADNMTIEWLGPRLYRPSFEEALRGALSPETADVHYIDHFRYPSHGGFVSYLETFRDEAELRLGHEVTAIDPRARVVRFSNGLDVDYDGLISSIPLPALIELIAEVPAEVKAAANRLGWTKAVVVNLGLGRADISQAHWIYFYDEDFIFTRINFPHMLSPNTVPPGMGSIQAEIYFSDKYKPMDTTPEECIPRVIDDLKRCGLLREDDAILFSQATLSPWAQIIFDHEREAALATIHGYLEDIGITVCGRYGEWGYLWTDESFMSGERAAEEVLEKLGLASVSRA